MIPSNAFDGLGGPPSMSDEFRRQCREALRDMAEDGTLPFRVVFIEDEEVSEGE